MIDDGEKQNVRKRKQAQKRPLNEQHGNNAKTAHHNSDKSRDLNHPNSNTIVCFVFLHSQHSPVDTLSCSANQTTTRK